jgi:hypothetical protein
MSNDFTHRYGKPDVHFDTSVASDDALARNRNALPAHVVDRLVNSNYEHVVCSVIYNQKLSPEHVDKIIDDWAYFSSGVRHALAVTKHVQPHHIDKIIGMGDFWAQKDLAKHQVLQPHHIDKLINLNKRDINTSIAEHQKMAPEHIDHMIINGGPEQHEALASRTDLLDRHIKALNSLGY